MVKNQKGFTLIEAIIAVALLGIIVAIAIPAYDNQKRKGFRTDAIKALTKAAQLQERWYSRTGSYTNDMSKLGGTTTENGKYTISITFDSAKPEEYTLTATANGQQQEDELCYQLQIDHLGSRTSYKDDGTITSSQLDANLGDYGNCWAN
jgi:type IV pilus assembly protein PilE